MRRVTCHRVGQNILTGSIVESLGNLVTLNILNFSHNNLSGSIPTTFSDLEFLIHLDLSYNHLQGEIPINGVFAKCKCIRYLPKRQLGTLRSDGSTRARVPYCFLENGDSI